VRLTLSRSVRSPAGPTATEIRNEYSVGFGVADALEFPDPDPEDVVDVVDGDTVELPEMEPPDVDEDERLLVLVVPAVVDDVALDGDVVVNLALLGSAMKCRRNGSLLSS